MVDKRKTIADIKLKGFKKVINKTVNEVFIKNYSEQYYIVVVLTKSHDDNCLHNRTCHHQQDIVVSRQTRLSHHRQ